MTEKNTKEIALEFVRYFCEQVCEKPAEISLNTEEDERGILILVSVANEDMGKIIGKQGQTITALRTLVRVISSREEGQKKIAVKIVDEKSGE